MEKVLNEYQKNIINDVLNGRNNIMIQAYAGCGKTSTLIEIMKVLPKNTKKIYFAFNKSIVEDIEKKTENIENLKNMTIHSFGLEVIRINSDFEIEIDETKYMSHINDHIDEYSDCYYSLDYNKKTKFRKNVLNLLNYGRTNLCDGKKCLEELAHKFGINLLGDEVECVIKLMKWGRKNKTTIDYNDMIWLPYYEPYRFPKYDYVFVDECQDLSVAQQFIVTRCKNIKTRFIFCGDKYQSIYAFNGADEKSFDKLLNFQNTKLYRLPICYRCSDLIIDVASQIVPGIEHNGFGNNGEVKTTSGISDINVGDMVICRTNSPLAFLAMSLLKKGVPCYIKGNDFANELIEMVDSTFQNELSTDLKTDGVFIRLYDSLLTQLENIKEYEKCDDKTAMLNQTFRFTYDKIKMLFVLSEGLTNKTELVERIKTIFSDKDKNGVILSTIHKSKGLENNVVHILNMNYSNDTPYTKNLSEWEKQQEKNLKYVAITRAKNKLTFIENKECSNYDNIMTLEELAVIQYNVNKILGNTHTIKKITNEYAKVITDNFSHHEVPKTKTITGNDIFTIKKSIKNNFFKKH